MQLLREMNDRKPVWVELGLQTIYEKMVIHRLTGDGDKKTLIAPEWSKDKKGTEHTA